MKKINPSEKQIMYSFWIDNPKILIELIENPPDNLSFVDKLNIIFAVSIILSIILVLINKFDLSYIILAIIVGLLTIFLNEQKNLLDKENFSQKCNKSSIHNPFMNPNVFDNNHDLNLDPCDDNDNILNDNFYQNTFRDVNDFYERGLSVRQFYTVPGKKIPNDRNTLAQWLYNSNYNKVSCKEGNDVRCMKNLDLERTDTRRSGIGGERSPP